MFSIFYRVRKLIVAIASLLVFLIILGPMAFSGYKLFESLTVESFNKPFQYADEVTRDFVANVVPLELSVPQGAPCDADLLAKMRFAEFSSRNLRDIGYVVDEHLICTTYQGLLDQPVKVTDHGSIELESSVQVWPDEPLSLFDQVHKTTIIKFGRFNSTLSFNNQKMTRHTSSTFMNYINDHGKNFHVSGSKRLFNTHYTRGISDEIFFDFPHLVSRRCKDNLEGDNAISCFIFSFDLSHYAAENKYYFAILVLMTVALYRHLFRLLNRIATQVFSLENQVRYGLNKERLILNYQPIIDITTRKAVGFEVLCRWLDEDDEICSPAVFLPEIEKLELQAKLTTLVLQKSVKELLEASLLDEYRVSFNAYPCDIEKGVVDKTLDDVLPAQYRAQITIEITEQQITNLDSMRAELDVLKLKGYHIAIDDFGTGFSNLAQLRDIRADYLKIDKSFVDDLEKDSILNTLIPHIISIAHNNNMEAVAEGVERTTQEMTLRQEGVILCQGYLYAKPMPLHALLTFLNQQSAQNESEAVNA